MSTEETVESGLYFEETELKLGPPGGKRGFSETVLKVDEIAPRHFSAGNRSPDSDESVTSGGGAKPPAAKVRAVGWPPVRSFRRNALQKSCSYVKVAVDGAAYLRKVDLDAYNDYDQLLTAIGAMFSCFTSKKYGKERRLVDSASGVEYVPTYEDKDGDLMLVGDDPWKVRAVGWPPVRSFRRNALQKSCSYVKVAVDGAAYLRKVDLDAYNDYDQLLTAIGAMFSCFTSKKYGKERRLVDSTSGVEYVPTYEDKDGDLMLVGDDPWKLFASSCKRIRLVKSTEAST